MIKEGSSSLSRRPSAVNFENVMNTKNIPVLFKLGKFCKNILRTF